MENVVLIEEIEQEKTLLTSHFQNGITLKKKEMMWKKIADKVNAVGGHGRTVEQLKKRWKDMKAAVLERQRKSTGTGGGGPLPEVPYEDIIRKIIGENTNLVNGIDGKWPVAVRVLALTLISLVN